MVSRDEAFLILKKWRDDNALLEWSEVVFAEDPQGESNSMARGFWQVRVEEVTDDSVTLRFDGSLETRQLPIPEASEFAYSDRRESRFPDLPVDVRLLLGSRAARWFASDFVRETRRMST
jgi:hypothetical protein